MAVAEDNALLPISPTHPEIWIHHKKSRLRAILILWLISSHQPVKQVAGHRIVFPEKHIGRMPRGIEVVPPFCAQKIRFNVLCFPCSFPKMMIVVAGIVINRLVEEFLARFHRQFHESFKNHGSYVDVRKRQLKDISVQYESGLLPAMILGNQ